MNIIPKFAGGGGMSSLFTVYQPTATPLVQAPTNIKLSVKDSDSVTVTDSSSKKKSDDSEDTKGKLTEKDLYLMIKDVDGLPNEMKRIITLLKNTMAEANLTGVSTEDISSAYLNSLYLLKVANLNKKKFDEAITDAKTNGSLGEVAISLSGNLMVSDKDGNVREMSLQDYQKSSDKYQVLTNSNLAWLRKYSSKSAFATSDNAFEIISNGVGFESFQKILDTAKSELGNQSYNETGIAGKEALMGLKTLQNASLEQQLKYISEALDGKYEYTSSQTSNQGNIKAYIQYLTAVLPKRMKVWAAVKTGITDENQAALTLVGAYLAGKITESSTYSVKYAGTEEKLKTGRSDSSSGSSSEPKKGFWQQLQTEQGGDTLSYNLLVGRGQMSVTGKYYGTTPGMEENTSLSKYIGNSKVGYLIKNTRGITFGDLTISSDSFDDVMVNAAGGAMVTTLPIKADGTVNFDILGTYTKIESKLKAAGLKPGTEKYNKAKVQVLKKVGLGYLVDAANGQVNPKYFGHFLILEGVASSKTRTLSYGETSNVNATDFVKDASGNDQLFTTVKRALSDKDKGEYLLDNNWFKFNNDKLYKGNIYIPLNLNALNGANADNVEVKVSQAQGYEHDMLRQEERLKNWEKAQRKQSTNADLI